jgi:FAD/FMN-containing dehydrogenase
MFGERQESIMTRLALAALDGSEQLVDEVAVEELQRKLRRPLLRPGTEGYEEARRVWNGVHDKRPGLIARCTGVADVIDAVNFAREHGLLVAIRSGGHNVAGTALCDRGVVIDLSRLRRVRVNPRKRTAEVDPGATLADVDRETQAFGLVLPAGVVSTTGIAGLTLGGGIGWVRRKHGMTIDNLLSVDIVTADGRLLLASEDENADLFWAVRGGGGNFGIVTSFGFRLHPLGPMVYFAAPMYSIERASEILPRWDAFCRDASDNVTSALVFQTLPATEPFPEVAWNREVVALPTLYAGPVNEGEKILRSLREIGEKVLDLSGPLPFRALQQAFDWVFPTGGRYYWKTTTLPALDDKAVRTLVEIGTSRSSPGTMIGVLQMGGAMAHVPEQATGYGPRSAPWCVNVDSSWADPAEDERHIAFTRMAWEKLQAVSDGGMYLHYGVRESEVQIRKAYGANYARLVEIKTRYDPMNLFRVTQNILPAAHTRIAER